MAVTLAHSELLDQRAYNMDDFLRNAGWSAAARDPLQADASFRRYIRLTMNGMSSMLMDAPPKTEDVRPFVKVARHLTGLGFSAPSIYAQDIDQGFLLLEDFGNSTFTQLLNQGMSEDVLYETAIDALIALHNNKCNADVDLPLYDESPLMEEVDLFFDWYLPELSGAQKHSANRDEFRDAWKQVLSYLPKMEPTIVLRDFHVDNLMLLPNQVSPKNCGLLDFQDALIGSPAYDVASLLEDARRDISEVFRQKMLTRYFGGRSGINQADFESSYRILSAQRHMKIIGIFTRLYRRDGKAHYLRHMTRVMTYLQQHLTHPELAPVRNWLEAHVPEYATLPTTLMHAMEQN